MALVSENLKRCCVKIDVNVCWVPSSGSGVVYETPNYCPYNYVLTAKHLFQEDSATPFDINKVNNIKIHYLLNNKFSQLEYLNNKELKINLIEFEGDLAIIKIHKNEHVNFRQIIVTDKLEDSHELFFSWAIFSANTNELHKFEFKRNDPDSRRIRLTSSPQVDDLPGMSGAGVFIDNKNILYGVISKYPNRNFANDTIDCADISLTDVNHKLKALGLIELDTVSIKRKREINGTVVDIHQATVNEVCLDFELARRRLKADIIDDWYYDPLKYIDLLDQDYIFKQFEDYFDDNRYKAEKAEQFFVPKKKLTLRQALVSPFIDRIMYMAVVGVLAERIDDAMIPQAYSARYNRYSGCPLIVNGVEQWRKMSYQLASVVNTKNEKDEYTYNCIIKADLLNFYDNINKSLLIEKIERVCQTPNEKNACALLDSILEQITDQEVGIPQNSDASALLASFYLNQVDVFMHNSTFAYYRFMDDIQILCSDKYEARSILQALEYELRRCGLSVNSQKTEIFSISDDKDNLKDGEILRSEFNDIFDIEIAQISRLRKSKNYAYLNQAFHLSVELLKDNVSDDFNSSQDRTRRLNYALSTIELLGKKNINIYSSSPDFNTVMLTAVKSLFDKPWITTQVCKILNLMDTEAILENYLEILKQIVLDDRYNTYTFQLYQIWLLFAKHKCKDEDLIKYAVRGIEKNDYTNRPVIGAMVIYLCSVDNNFPRVILRMFKEGRAYQYFQIRHSLISLRSFDPKLIDCKHLSSSSLKHSALFTNRFGHKDLVYVYGFNEDDSEADYFEQLFSL